MLILTLDTIPDTAFDVLGIVHGNTVQCKNVGRDIMSGFKNLVGGEMQSYTTLMQEAREIALSRMQDAAARLCADAVIGVRYSSCEIAQGAAEVLAYGTAVKFRSR